MYTHSDKKRMSRIIAIALLLSMIIPIVFSEQAHAYTTAQLRQKKVITSFSSGKSTDDDYLHFAKSGSLISVTFNHSQSFDRISLRLEQGKAIKYKQDYPNPDATTFFEPFDFSNVADGTYYLRLVVQKDENQSSGLTNYPTYWQGIYVKVKSGVPTMYYFNYINGSNLNKKGSSTSYYKRKSMSELKYQLFAKKNSKTPRTIYATKEANYYKKVSDQILADANLADSTDKYQKMKALFTFVADNYYYDYYNPTRKYSAYDDPYYNLYNLMNKKSNNHNAVLGKVALHCDGYTGILMALGRAQDIPCRMIYGRKIVPTTSSNWSNCSKSYFTSNSHTWMQAYIDGRWINIDPQQGSLNQYGKKGVAGDKTWRKSSIVNYTYFDISYKLLSYTHYSRTMPKGAK
ncbi:transglutaminase-like putative cysteine protease [Clostridiales Family XIII bacterium PM5-7]